MLVLSSHNLSKPQEWDSFQDSDSSKGYRWVSLSHVKAPIFCLKSQDTQNKSTSTLTA